MKPILGRFVSFYTAIGSMSHVAMIVHVFEDETVNLVVWDHVGQMTAVLNVHFHTKDGEPAAVPFAEYTPWQIAHEEKPLKPIEKTPVKADKPPLIPRIFPAKKSEPEAK